MTDYTVTIHGSEFGLDYDGDPPAWTWADKVPLCPHCLTRQQVNPLEADGRDKVAHVMTVRAGGWQVVCEACDWHSEVFA